MAETIKVLAQSAPLATTLTDVYTAPNSAVVSSIVVCNRSSTATTFRLSIAVSGAADDNVQYLYYNLPIMGEDTFVATIGATLAAADVIRAYVANATVTFTILGAEVV